MKTWPIMVLSVLVLVQNAPAQNTDKTLYFVHLTQNLKEVAQGMQAIAGFQEPALDEAKRSLTLRGTAEQVALGEWLFKSLDVASGTQDPNVGAPYRVSGTDDVVRIFYLTYTATVQDVYEVATMIRTIGEVRQVWAYPPQKAMILRGTGEQLAMAEWMSTALDRHKQGQSPMEDFKLAAGPENTVRMLWAATPTGMQPFQEMATAVRTISEIRRVFTYNGQQAIAARGTADQMNLAAWLMAELDQPAHAVLSPYTIPGTLSNTVRVFFVRPSVVNPANRNAEFQKIATEIRTSGNIRQVFIYSPTLAILVRGAESQMTVAEKMLEGKVLASVQ